MSEIIDNSRKRVDTLKSLIMKLHLGFSPDDTRKELEELLGSVPYGEVVQAEQELVEEGLPQSEIIKYCDLHSAALRGKIAPTPERTLPSGHPVHTFEEENKAIKSQLEKYRSILTGINKQNKDSRVEKEILEIRSLFNTLMDIEKHYVRKENLVFPFLEKHGITAPPAVMWGKHDEIRAFLKSTHQSLLEIEDISIGELIDLTELLLTPTINAIDEMIYKEEKILFPMCLDTLTEIEWYEVYQQSDEIGYCLYDPIEKWEPEFSDKLEVRPPDSGKIQLSTGSFSIDELDAALKTLPVDITFVDKDDKVKYFSFGKERIFERNRAILGRQVQYCHPPSSVHIVEKILSDFKSGKEDAAKFWINFHGKYVHIAYYAVRDDNGNYLGTLEVTQDIAEFKKVEGERRILSYE